MSEQSHKREWYYRNKQKVIDYNRNRRHCLVDWINTIKAARGCAYCSENDPLCLDFHHNSEGKDLKISSAVDRWGKKRILNEIKKCVVLCANCHRKLHRPARNADVLLRDAKYNNVM